MVQEGHPRLKAMGHTHAVFHLEQAWQECLEVEMGHHVEVRLLAHVLTVENRTEGLEWRIFIQRIPIDLLFQGRSAVDKTVIALVQGLEEALPPELSDQGLIVLQRDEIRYDGLIGDDKVAVRERAIDGALYALFEIGEQIPDIAAEDLVGPLPTQDHLPVL